MQAGETGGEDGEGVVPPAPKSIARSTGGSNNAADGATASLTACGGAERSRRFAGRVRSRNRRGGRISGLQAKSRSTAAWRYASRRTPRRQAFAETRMRGEAVPRRSKSVHAGTRRAARTSSCRANKRCGDSAGRASPSSPVILQVANSAAAGCRGHG